MAPTVEKPLFPPVMEGYFCPQSCCFCCRLGIEDDKESYMLRVNAPLPSGWVPICPLAGIVRYNSTPVPRRSRTLLRAVVAVARLPPTYCASRNQVNGPVRLSRLFKQEFTGITLSTTVTTNASAQISRTNCLFPNRTEPGIAKLRKPTDIPCQTIPGRLPGRPCRVPHNLVKLVFTLGGWEKVWQSTSTRKLSLNPPSGISTAITV